MDLFKPRITTDSAGAGGIGKTFAIGTPVLYRLFPKANPPWAKAVVVERRGEVVYQVRDVKTGKLHVRHLNHLLLDKTDPQGGGGGKNVKRNTTTREETMILLVTPVGNTPIEGYGTRTTPEATRGGQGKADRVRCNTGTDGSSSAEVSTDKDEDTSDDEDDGGVAFEAAQGTPADGTIAVQDPKRSQDLGAESPDTPVLPRQVTTRRRKLRELIIYGDNVIFEMLYLNNDMQIVMYIVRLPGKHEQMTAILLKGGFKGKNPLPARFQMMGRNTEFGGSHFDKYEVVYTKVQVFKKIDPATFDVPTNYTCTEFSNAGENKMSFNPMQEFINNDDSHVEESFAEFKDKHNKVYTSETEHEERKNNFRHNLRFIHSTNRQRNGFTLAVNHLADKTDKEMRILRGKQRSNSEYNGGLPFPYHHVSHLPDSLDWRLSGAVTPVKDQAICGSCWSFGTTGTIEGAYFVHTGHLVHLSEQALIDCSWKFGNNGCDGGEDYRSYQWIMNGTGLPLADSYGPYLGQDGICGDNSKIETVKITGYVNITSGDCKALRVAMFSHGPISVAIDARSDEDGLDHIVLAVGFGIMDGEKYWLIKNSWSTYWGNDGYVLMSQKDNNCGVATEATYDNATTHV
uniref:Peptidase C1A papain C-terminal domain-containing protein n=1 Tax=Strigamia maritima TaxID=126957 RepID=T1INL6_STRMM